jgi:carbamoyl-phosphate synthase large subunit
VMGIDERFGLAFAKAQTAAGTTLPSDGTVFLSLADRDKPAGIVVARRFKELGLAIVATQGTAEHLGRFGVEVDGVVAKLSDRTGTSAVDLIASGKITFVVNTPQGSGPRSDGSHIRTAANVHKVSCVTTVAAALAAAHGMAERAANPRQVRSLQEWHAR